MLLGINTSDKITEFCLLDSKKILFEYSRVSQKDEAETLLNEINQKFSQHFIGWKDISSLFVVRGPGNFTSVRVGIAIANALSFVLKIPIYAMILSELSNIRNPKDSFGSALIKINLKKIRPFKIVPPYYDREPNISKSSKPLSYC